MDRRNVFSYFVACASPALLGGIVSVFLSHHSASFGQVIAMALLFAVAGGLFAMPIAVPLILIAVRAGCLRFWNSVVGGAICGALLLALVETQQYRLHPAGTSFTLVVLLTLVIGAATGMFFGLVFALVLRTTGYFHK